MSTSPAPSESTSSSLVVLDSEPIDLRAAPPSSSRIVRTAREHLLSDLHITTLSDDLARVSRLLSLSRAAAYAASYHALAQNLTILSTKLLSLFDATCTAIFQFRVAADAILSDLPHNHDLMASRQLQVALENLEGNDNLAEELADSARELSNQLAAAAEDASDALEAAQTRRAQCEEDRARLEERMTELNVRKAAAWHTHGAMLESLSEAGRMYAHAAKTERLAVRRAKLFWVLGFIDVLDGWLSGSFNLHLLSPMRKFLESVREDVVKAGEQKRMLLNAKTKQRRLNREALQDISECSQRIREVKSDADAVMAAIESLHVVAGELKRLSVVVMRMAAFWGQLRANMGRLSSRDLVRLIRATAEPEMLEDVGVKEEEKETEIDVSVAQDAWEPCTAVKRKLVGYYARWVALSDVCGDCFVDIVGARGEVKKEIEDGKGVEQMSTMEARLCVARMAANLRREMQMIQEEMEMSKAELGVGGEGSVQE